MKKLFLITAGYVALVLGVVGIFIPLLPTTPFLLVAAICFFHSSKKLYNWMTHHRLFGNYIRCFHEFRAVSKKTKIFAIVLLWATILFSTLFVATVLWVQILLLVIAAGVTIHLVLLRTLTKEMMDELK